MAGAISLYGLGLALETQPKPSGTELLPIAIVVGVVSTLFLVGDLLQLSRAELFRRRALRIPAREFGTLDYVPEFTKAVGEYVAAQAKITEAASAASPVLVETNTRVSQEQVHVLRQALGITSAEAADRVCQAMDTNLPVMKDNAAVMRQCYSGC